jgi:molybdopterin-guanine dinucleotide biosynthesis protein B
MAPVISIIGKSKSGQTTLIEKLIQELKSRGYRVATIERVPEKADLDKPGKDSWHHIKAGSEATVASSPDEIMLIKPVSREATIDEIQGLLGEDYDIILAEGFEQGGTPKIEVHHKGGGALIKGLKKLIAIVTDEPLETRTRQFSPDDMGSLVDLLEKGFIKPQKERTSLYVNNIPITLTLFPKQIITNVLLAIASCLKGVGDIRSIKIFVKRE